MRESCAAIRVMPRIWVSPCTRMFEDMPLIVANNGLQRERTESTSRFLSDLRRPLSVHSSATLAGFPTTTGHHEPEPGSVSARPLSTQWLSDERIAEARRVWSKAYGRVISADEAIEILMNVRRLAEVLLTAEEEKRKS